MIGIYIGFGPMTVAAVFGYCANRRLIKVLDKIDADNKELGKMNKWLHDWQTGYINSKNCKAEIEELTDCSTFYVFRKFNHVGYVVKFFDYDPNDPDDRDYKRICAEELVEKLNEEV